MTEKLIDKLNIVEPIEDKPNLAERLAYGKLGFSIMSNIKNKIKHQEASQDDKIEKESVEIQDAQQIVDTIDIESLNTHNENSQLNR